MAIRQRLYSHFIFVYYKDRQWIEIIQGHLDGQKALDALYKDVDVSLFYSIPSSISLTRAETFIYFENQKKEKKTERESSFSSSFFFDAAINYNKTVSFFPQRDALV